MLAKKLAKNSFQVETITTPVKPFRTASTGNYSPLSEEKLMPMVGALPVHVEENDMERSGS